MRFTPEPSEDTGDLLKAPAMVDVVFILLAFFVLATQFLVPERDFTMGHREAGTGGGAVREDFPSIIQVRLRRTDAGVAITVGRARLPHDNYDAIREKLSQINMPAIGVLILADPSLRIDDVARALDAALASPMKKVSVAKLAVKASPRKGA